MTANTPPSFICPECSHHHSDQIVDIEPLPSWKQQDYPVYGLLRCVQCKFFIPDHLTKRSDNMTVEVAQQIWRDHYRSHAIKENKQAYKTQIDRVIAFFERKFRFKPFPDGLSERRYSPVACSCDGTLL